MLAEMGYTPPPDEAGKTASVSSLDASAFAMIARCFFCVSVKKGKR
jgi:hypothetical protein